MSQGPLGQKKGVLKAIINTTPPRRAQDMERNILEVDELMKKDEVLQSGCRGGLCRRDSRRGCLSSFDRDRGLRVRRIQRVRLLCRLRLPFKIGCSRADVGGGHAVVVCWQVLMGKRRSR